MVRCQKAEKPKGTIFKAEKQYMTEKFDKELEGKTLYLKKG
jgi:hypothetical protein